ASVEGDGGDDRDGRWEVHLGGGPGDEQAEDEDDERLPGHPAECPLPEPEALPREGLECPHRAPDDHPQKAGQRQNDDDQQQAEEGAENGRRGAFVKGPGTDGISSEHGAPGVCLCLAVASYRTAPEEPPASPVPESSQAWLADHFPPTVGRGGAVSTN